MDDLSPPADGRPVLRPTRPDVELPPDFVPLWLIVQPSGLAVELTRPELLVGRHSECDLRLTLPDISRRHCRLVFAVRRWQVQDVGSLNGVLLNGQPVQEAALSHGDVLDVGSFRFAVDLRTGISTLHLPAQSTGRSPSLVLGLTELVPPDGPGGGRRQAS
jgi:hypothetical protein